ncbi:zinc dependent phospholipase C family protein [Bacillus sp. CGMCC 1.16607]|uniref:zinc dependent phospholipase C family protein n=1 Tax=Bacillus sp. CGMCC 1.16607 TaxID=3351842 RepID=UPI003643A566
MGSRIMHLIIANQIAQRVKIADRTSFLLGGVAPDAVSPKDLSHFYRGDLSEYTRSIGYDIFIGKYRHYQHSEYILGYYSHLIADDLWLKGFYLPWLKNRMEQDNNVFDQYHQDFQLLNGKLLNYYRVDNDILRDLDNNDSIIDLQEVTVKDVKGFIPYLLKDMDYDQKDIKEDLQVFTFDQIIGYVETSIEKGIFHLKKMIKYE